MATATPEISNEVAARPEIEHTPPFQPYIPAEARLPEFTPLPVIVGTILGMVFGASSLYLVLKVGLTVSASIPVAVLSITLFRLLSKFGLRNANILENNIVQTAGSAGESIAFGVGVTMPAIMILGFDLEFTRVMLVAVLGGLLGILMMIPLRRALIVKQHGILKYPEGTACAVVLKAGASDESKAAAHSSHAADEGAEVRALPIFSGLGIGAIYMAVMKIFAGWKDTPEKVFGVPFKAGSVSAEISPALLGVGYIIGPRIASIMCAGGVLAYLVLIPAIKFFGQGSGVIPPGHIPISEMSPGDIRGAYVLYIGAGAVAAGGIISLFRSLPTIWHGLKGGLKDLKGGAAALASAPRTDQDMSMKFVIGGIIALVVMIMAARNLHMNLLGAILIVLFGFLFVTVSSRLTGEIGSSSNPISGMTVATLLLTCLMFLVMGWTGQGYYVTALSVGAIVCIAASNGGTTSQDLKTGFLVGSTPRLQQIAILIGAFASALILGPILLLLNSAAVVYAPRIVFEKATGIAQIEQNQMASLPVYADTIPPPVAGQYRTLTISVDAPSPTKLDPGEYLVSDSGTVAYKVQHNFSADLHANAKDFGKTEKLKGPQAGADKNVYHIWQKFDPASGTAQRFMVNDQGVPVYLVDPGINGLFKKRPDGSSVTKFDAPKAVLMSYIINGILSQKLPWGLVLLGVMISIVLEMSGIPSLAFAVGVYLPLSSSSPIFIGGMIRWLVDLNIRRKLKHKKLSEEELAAEGDRSPGVLMASGYIAGGAIAGIFYALLAGFDKSWLNAGSLQNALAWIQGREDWAKVHNPFFSGPNSDLLSTIPFLILMVLLYLAGREAILAGKPKAA